MQTATKNPGMMLKKDNWIFLNNRDEEFFPLIAPSNQTPAKPERKQEAIAKASPSVKFLASFPEDIFSYWTRTIPTIIKNKQTHF